MNDAELILIGFALGAIPSWEMSRLLIAFAGKRMGIEPKDVEEYSEATQEDSS